MESAVEYNREWKWRVESGEWKVESGEWKVESGEWRVGEYRVEKCRAK